MFVKSIDFEEILDKSSVKLTETGNIFEVMFCYRKSKGSDVRKLSNDCYYQIRDFLNPRKDEVPYSEFNYNVDISTGEVFFDTFSKNKDFCYKNGTFYPVKHYKKTSNRFQSINELRRTFKKVRNIINCNVVDIEKCKFCTLTYAENMTDTKRLCDDFRKFNQRFKRYVFNKFGMKYEYIAIAEPQGRGAWHMHIIYIFDGKAPYIHYTEYNRIWGLGAVDLQAFKNVDNVGAYFSAYLSNIALDGNSEFDANLSNNKIITKGKGRNKKRFVKGGRLSMYPTKFNILRTSRGIKRPVVEEMSYSDAKNIISSFIPPDEKLENFCTFRNGIEVHVKSQNDFYNKIFYEYYNVVRKSKKKPFKVISSDEKSYVYKYDKKKDAFTARKKIIYPDIKKPDDSYSWKYIIDGSEFAKMVCDAELNKKYKNILINYDIDSKIGYKEFSADKENIKNICDEIFNNWLSDCTVIGEGVTS